MSSETRLKVFLKVKIFSSIKSLWKALIGLMLLSIAYNEFLINVLQSFKWSNVSCEHKNCTRILFVADPQLLGETFDSSFYSSLANYDSDWHLKKTFNRALAHARPNVICFLGDIFDEGSVADEAAYQRYYDRFKDIFMDDETSTIKMVFVPGDNDIGGEGIEPIKPTSVNRFRKMFYERDTWKIGDIIFYNINKITQEMPATDPQAKHDNFTRIFLSHLPLLEWNSRFSRKAIDTFKPHLIFSGHHHMSLISRMKYKRLDSPGMPSSLNNDKKTAYAMNHFDLNELIDNNEVLEINIPTCSYRMGTMDIGYGYAVIDQSQLYYTVLWVSQRFYQLGFYLSLLLLILVYVLVFKLPLIMSYCSHRRRSRGKSDRPYRYLPL